MSVEAAFTEFPLLTTARLRLREPRDTDAQAVFAIKSNDAVTRHYAQEPHRSIEDTLKWLHELQDSYRRRDALFWCITLLDDDTAIGAGGFWNFDADFHCVELGYELHPAYGGRGIMSEAVSSMLRYGFAEIGWRRVEAMPFAKNDASVHLLQKLDFTLEGSLRQRRVFRGEYLDQLYFGLLRDEWMESNQSNA